MPKSIEKLVLVHHFSSIEIIYIVLVIQLIICWLKSLSKMLRNEKYWIIVKNNLLFSSLGFLLLFPNLYMCVFFFFFFFFLQSDVYIIFYRGFIFECICCNQVERWWWWLLVLCAVYRLKLTTSEYIYIRSYIRSLSSLSLSLISAHDFDFRNCNFPTLLFWIYEAIINEDGAARVIWDDKMMLNARSI